MFSLEDFVRESNRIEGIHRDPTQLELNAHEALLDLPDLDIAAVETFVGVVAPGHRLRSRAGWNVRVGNHIAPPGGPAVVARLKAILSQSNDGRSYKSAYLVHRAYETLHPFTDGNGRSGRAIWLWQMSGHAPLGFLHHWYYQTLEFSRRAREGDQHDEG